MTENYNDTIYCPHCGEGIEFEVHVENGEYVGAQTISECTICEKSKSEHHIYQGYE